MNVAKWSGLALVLGLVGCTQEVDSTDIRTSGVYPEITVTADGSGNSEVSVLLKVGGSASNTYLDLRGDDELTANAEGVTKTLERSDSHAYVASFDTDAGGTEFVVSLMRGTSDDDAPNSTVVLPAPFELELDKTEASRAGDDINVSWDPAGAGNVNWDTTGDCIIHDDGDTPDDGTDKLAAGSIDAFTSDKMKSCTVDFTLTRELSGTTDPAFKKVGVIKARQVRKQSFTSDP